MKEATDLTLYVLKICFSIFLIPIVLTVTIMIDHQYIGAIMLCGIVLVIKPVTYKIIIPKLEKKRNEKNKA